MPNEPPPIRRVVIVDDSLPLSVGLGDYIRHCLEDTEVLVFQDGLSAWQELSQTDPDVLITDMQRFSVMSGWDMLPLLAERNVKYPIFVITGYGEKNDSVDGKTLQDVRDLLQGACSNLNVTILRKPFALDGLRKELESCLKISSATQRRNPRLPDFPGSRLTLKENTDKEATNKTGGIGFGVPGVASMAESRPTWQAAMDKAGGALFGVANDGKVAGMYGLNEAAEIGGHLGAAERAGISGQAGVKDGFTILESGQVMVSSSFGPTPRPGGPFNSPQTIAVGCLDILIHISAGIYSGGFDVRHRDQVLNTIAKCVRAILAAIKPLGYPKATALLDEVLNLTRRMRPWAQQADIPADPGPAAGRGLGLAFATLVNYLNAHGVQCPLRVPPQPELMKMTVWSANAADIGATSDDDIEVLIDKVTQYLSTLCQ